MGRAQRRWPERSRELIALGRAQTACRSSRDVDVLLALVLLAAINTTKGTQRIVRASRLGSRGADATCEGARGYQRRRDPSARTPALHRHIIVRMFDNRDGLRNPPLVALLRRRAAVHPRRPVPDLVASLFLQLLELVLLQLVLHPDRLGAGALEGALLVLIVRVRPCPPLVDELANAEARARHSRTLLANTPSPLLLEYPFSVHTEGERWGIVKEINKMEKVQNRPRSPGRHISRKEASVGSREGCPAQRRIARGGGGSVAGTKVVLESLTAGIEMPRCVCSFTLKPASDDDVE